MEGHSGARACVCVRGFREVGVCAWEALMTHTGSARREGFIGGSQSMDSRGWSSKLG